MTKPDWENFSKAVLDEWPTGGLEGDVLFDLALEHGMIAEIPGGYDPDRHIDAEGICPEQGDPWYEYTFRGTSGPGLYSAAALEAENAGLRAKLAKAVEALKHIERYDIHAPTFARRTLSALKWGEE